MGQRSHKENRKYLKCNDNENTANKNLWGGDFPGSAVVKNLPPNAGDMGSIPGPGRSHMLWSN